MNLSESSKHMGIECRVDKLITNDMKINNAMLCIGLKNKTARDFLMCLSALVTIYCDDISIQAISEVKNKSRILVHFKSISILSSLMSYSEAIMDIRKHINQTNNYIDITITNISDNINVFEVHMFRTRIAKVKIDDTIDNLCVY